MSMQHNMLIEKRCGEATFLREEEIVIGGITYKGVVVKGKFANVGQATANGRSYPRRIWEAQIQRLTPIFEDKNWFGEMEHPKDGETLLQRTTHFVRNLWFEGSEVWGEAFVMPTDPHGKNLIMMMGFGCKVGVSSRGYGSVVKNAQGVDEVQEDFHLRAFDFVADPAAGAFPEPVMESVQNKDAVMMFEGVDFDSIEAAATSKETRSLAARVLKRFGSFSMSPPVAPISENVEDATLLSENKALREANSAIAHNAQVLSFQLHLEMTLKDHAHGDAIRGQVGDVSAFTSEAEFKTRIAAVTEGVLREHRRYAELEARYQSLNEAAWAENKVLKEKNSRSETLLEKAKEVIMGFEVRLYAEKRIGKNPHAEQIRQLIETSNPKTKADIQGLIEQFRPTKISTEAIAAKGAQVRRLMNQGGFTSTSLDEELATPRPQTSLRQETARLPVRALPSDDRGRNNQGYSDIQRLMPPGIFSS